MTEFINPTHYGAPTPIWEMRPDEIKAVAEACTEAYTSEALEAFAAQYAEWAATLAPSQHGPFIVAHEAAAQLLQLQAAMHQMLLQADDMGVRLPSEPLKPKAFIPD